MKTLHVKFLEDFLTRQLSSGNQIKVMFLSKEHEIITRLAVKYPEKIKRFWLCTNKVFDYLAACDYGILFREQTITNKVASPVKFAEYLSAGLKVLISENLGDLSEYAKKNTCGIIVKDYIGLLLPEVNYKEKREVHALAKKDFIRQQATINSKYKRLL